MKHRLRSVLPAILLAVAVNASADEGRWHIKCLAEGQTLAVKALTAEGMAYDVKASKSSASDLLDIKAFEPRGSARLHVKVVPGKQGSRHSDVKAIGNGNRILPIKAITSTGHTLHVKAFLDSKRNQYDIQCLADAKWQPLKAISPTGQVYDVKGLSDLPGQAELEVEIEAHIKAKPQQGDFRELLEVGEGCKLVCE